MAWLIKHENPGVLDLGTYDPDAEGRDVEQRQDRLQQVLYERQRRRDIVRARIQGLRG